MHRLAAHQASIRSSLVALC